MMSIVDKALGPSVWAVPYYSGGWVNKFMRTIKSWLYAKELRAFFLGMIVADTQMSAEDKKGFYAWLEEVGWSESLIHLSDRAYWKQSCGDNNPISASFEGVNGEYQRLFRCYQHGMYPY